MTDQLVMGDSPDGGSDRETKEVLALGAHERKLAETLVGAEVQRVSLRWWVWWVTVTVIIFLAVLECVILANVLNSGSKSNDLIVLLAVSPIASITLIVIFVLIGAFRSIREIDLNSLPLKTAGKAMLGNGS